MTRFEQEINGMLGEYWVENAKREVEYAVRHANEAAIVEEDGAIRWATNGRYLMDDYCEKLEYAGYEFSREATAEKRDGESKRFIEHYRNRMKNYQPTTEELAEMRNAFGEGSVVVDVLSGNKFYV